MATSTTDTLAIKDFRGINRFNDGTVTPPNEFEVMQNYHPVNRGQVQSILGTTKLNPAAMPGVAEIVGLEWLNQSFGDRKLIAFFRPNISTIAAPSVDGTNFTSSGGSPVVHDFVVTYVGPGGSVNFTYVAGVTCNAVTTFTLPVSIPAYVACIDLYFVRTGPGSDDAYIWIASVSRRNGVFPASVNFIPNADSNTAVVGTSGVVIDVGSSLTSFIAKPEVGAFAVGGTLLSDRLYYVAIAPWNAQKSFRQSNGGRQTRAYNAIGGTQAGVLSFNLPAGISAVNLKFTFNASPVMIAGTAVHNWVLFIGETPEDMMAVCDRIDGSVMPVSDSIVRSGIVIRELPYNARNTIHMTSSGNMDQGGVSLQAPSARDYGIFKNMQWSNTIADNVADGGGEIVTSDSFGSLPPFANLPYLGAWVIPSFPFSPLTAYQLLPHINERNYTKSLNYGANYREFVPQNDCTPNPIVFYDPVLGLTNELHTVQYSNRLYCANGENVMFYTNGYSIKTVVPDTPASGGQRIPICKYIGLVQDQIVLGGGENSFANFNNYVFYSDVANPNSFGDTSWNNFPVWAENSGKLNGFGVFSITLTGGPTTFLLISKDNGNYGEIYSWNAKTGSDLVISQLDKTTGFAGPRSWVQTRFGTIVISRSGAYIVNGSAFLTPIGDEVRDILMGLSSTALNLVSCTFHENKVKIGYRQSANLDREIWVELRFENGGIQKFWSGPHVMNPYNYQAAIGNFNGVLDFRVSDDGSGNLYQRDTGNLNNGSPIVRSIVINRLGMTQDHLRKLMQWVFLALQITGNETFTVIFNFEDGSVPYTISKTALFASAARQFLQIKIPDRIVGRIISVTINNTSSQQNSLFDISMLFKTQQRRLLG